MTPDICITPRRTSPDPHPTTQRQEKSRQKWRTCRISGASSSRHGPITKSEPSRARRSTMGFCSWAPSPYSVSSRKR
ncbi:hypothetical protein VUR80DRAFT_8997 [Thermomyces stellatus]